MNRLIKVLDGRAADFDGALTRLLEIDEGARDRVRDAVARIIRDLRQGGDEALVELTNRFDRRSVRSPEELVVSQERIEAALKTIDPMVREALGESASRIRLYHEAQKKAHGAGRNWQYRDGLGNTLGQRVRAMERVGIYAPGGKAAYPSTVLMTAIPARVAGVREVVLCAPAPGGEVDDVLLAAARLAGIEQVYSVGGAQAVAAMAYGTGLVAPVDKIVGPGNIYVTTAKELVFGQVGIDMLAGPSEVVIVADDSSRPDWVLQDLFAQAEHDEMARSILITPSEALIDQVLERLPAAMGRAQRAAIIRESLAARGAMIRVADLTQAMRIANRIAPEHLQLAVSEPEALLKLVRHAGAVFLGQDTAEVVGDYTAGPSHVLPTSGTARFGSPLGVYDFLVRTSVVHCSRKGAIELNRISAILARSEGLGSHAESAACRVRG